MTFIIYVESGDLIHRSAVRSARHGGPYTNIHTEGLAPSIAPKVIIEDLHGEKNMISLRLAPPLRKDYPRTQSGAPSKSKPPPAHGQ